MRGFSIYNRLRGVLYMNFYLDVNRWWYMILQLIRDSSSLQAIIWGIISVFVIKYLPPLVRELMRLSDNIDCDKQE